jgi:hypothetical protein
LTPRRTGWLRHQRHLQPDRCSAPIGPYDATSPPKKLEPSARGFSVAAARERCRELARAHALHGEDGGLRGAWALARDAKLRATEECRLAAAKAATEAEERARHTLPALLDDHVALQTSKGRITVREADSVFQRHVVAARPEIAQAPAADLTQEQVVDMLRLVIEQSKGRTSNKLRTYLRAAYQCAVDVWVTAAIPLSFKKYDVRANPVANTRRDASFDRSDKHPLTTDELRLYWRLIEKLPDLPGRCLRLHLLTGGQCIEQLVRLRWTDVRPDQITIYDIKGRPGQGGPRTHTLPLVDAAARDQEAFQRTGDYVFSTTEGVRPIAVQLGRTSRRQRHRRIPAQTRPLGRRDPPRCQTHQPRDSRPRAVPWTDRRARTAP